MSARAPAGRARDRGERMSDDGRSETPRERLDRNLAEMTGELRVVITGVQVLFAFLLVVPFDARFTRLDSFERAVYFVTLLLAALAAVFTIAPSAQHRILFRRNEKAHLVFSASDFAIAGLVCLALAMCGALLLVATVLFGTLAVVLTALAMSVPFGVVWFALPWRRARRDDERDSARRSRR